MRPSLRFAYQKISKHLHTCNVFEFFGVDKIAFKRWCVHIIEYLDEASVFIDKVIG